MKCYCPKNTNEMVKLTNKIVNILKWVIVITQKKIKAEIIWFNLSIVISILEKLTDAR